MKLSKIICTTIVVLCFAAMVTTWAFCIVDGVRISPYSLLLPAIALAAMFINDVYFTPQKKRGATRITLKK